MPAPIELNSYAALNPLNPLKPPHLPAAKDQEYIDFYEYPIQSVFEGCTAIDDTFCHRDVEDSFCRDFSCCGLELSDLHDLLQHYEECHVRFEAEDDSTLDLYNEDWTSTPTRNAAYKKQRISASLSDMYCEETASQNGETNVSAFNNSVLRTGKASIAGKKRPLDPLDTTRQNSLCCPPSTVETVPASKKMTVCAQLEKFPSTSSLLTSTVETVPASKKMTVCTQVEKFPSASSTPMSSAPTTPSSLKSPSSVTIAANSDLLVQLDPAAALFPRTSYFAVADDLSAQLEDLYGASNKITSKPYKCTIAGCDKDYKSANGLKYHTINSHGGLEIPPCKSYKCTVLECGKRYKNLNGLKYHIEHSHVLTSNK